MAFSSYNPPKNKYDLAFENFPPNQLFRLFIDKNRQDEGEDTFDKDEPGYKQAMLNAFSYMQKTMDKKLDVAEFKAIHAICINNVKGINSKETEFSPGQYGLDNKKTSQAAREEWESENLIFTPAMIRKSGVKMTENQVINFSEKFLSILALGKAQSQFDANDPNLPTKVNGFFDAYYAKITEAKNDDDKLIEIVSLCRKLEIAHLFLDGNQRTIVFVVLNKLLIENSFHPVIVDDPYVFDGYLSKQELVQSVKVGMQNFLSIGYKNKLNEKFSVSKNTLFRNEINEIKTPKQEVGDKDQKNIMGVSASNLWRRK